MAKRTVSKAFVKAMEKQFPKGATITPKKSMPKAKAAKKSK
jgi:hypothetical protein